MQACVWAEHGAEWRTVGVVVGVLNDEEHEQDKDGPSPSRDGAGVGGSASSVNVTFLSIHDFRPRPLARPGQPQLADLSNTATAEPSLYC